MTRKHRELKNLEKYRENMEFLCLPSKFIAFGVDGGCVARKKLIEHAIFAHNTQGNFLNKTGKIQGI